MAIIITIAVTFFAVFIANVHAGDTCDACECTLSNIEILSQLIDERINATVSERVTTFTATIEERVNATIDERLATVNTTLSYLNATSAKFLTQPGEVCNTLCMYQSTSFYHYNIVMTMLYIALSGTTISLRTLSTTSQAVGDYLSTLTIPNFTNEYTSNNNILAYRPNFRNSNTAILFINLEAVIPCYDTYQIGPACNLFTFEEDNFQSGKPFIQASDIGNAFFIFSNTHNIATYGFGVFGCTTFDPGCVSTSELSLVCLLPPDRCG